MPFEEGNEYWKARSSHGRKPIFEKPEDILDSAQQFFKWCQDNPLIESRPFAHMGKITMAEVPKMRAMTIEGLCRYIGISQQAWSEYKQRDGFGEVTSEIDGIIRDQKFTGAAAGFLNANIIARDLGLAEKTDNSHSVLMIPVTSEDEQL